MNEPIREPEISYTEKARTDFAAFLRLNPRPTGLHPVQLLPLDALQALEDQDSIEAKYETYDDDGSLMGR